MKRLAFCCCLLTALIFAGEANAAPLTSTSGSAKTLSGKVTAISGFTFTIQTTGKLSGTLNELIRAGNRITKQNLPYVVGGGHAKAGRPSRAGGSRHAGYDCSGAVAAVLAGAKLWHPGSPVPGDTGVISELRSRHKIARGAGAAPNEVDLYDDPGSDIFMSINGHLFGTGANGKNGPGWLDDLPAGSGFGGYKTYHFAAAALRDSPSSGEDYTFELPFNSSLPGNLAVGDEVAVTYVPKRGELVARSVKKSQTPA